MHSLVRLASKIAAAALLASLLVHPARAQVTPPPTQKASAAPAGRLDEKAALAKVTALPEVDETQKQLARAKVRLVIRRDDDQSGARFEFAVAEDHDDHEVTRYRFAVDPATGAISAYQVECDLWAPLEKWRALRKKLAAMKPAEREGVDTCDELSK